MRDISGSGIASRPRSSGALAPDHVAAPGNRRGTVWFALSFALLVVVVPWPAIWEAQNGTPMEDRRVYESQVANSFLSFDVNTFQGLSSYVSNEYLWGWFLNLTVRILGIPLDVVFAMVSAFVIFVACLVVCRNAPKAYALLLINPIFINLAFSQLRIALAMALVCTAYLLRGRRVVTLFARVALLVGASMIHTSMVVFIGLFLVAAWVAREGKAHSPLRSYLLLALVGIAVAVVLGPMRNVILSEVGDRREGMDYLSSSFKFYVMWIALGLVMTLTWNQIRLTVASAFALATAITVLVGLPLDVYVNRIIAISLPFLIASIHGVPRTWRALLLVAYLVYDIIYWLYWLNLMS